MTNPPLNLTNQELLQEIKKLLTEDASAPKTEPIPFTTTVPLFSPHTLLKAGLIAGMILLTLYFTRITIRGTISKVKPAT